MHNGTKTENNRHGGDYNMYEGYKKLTEDEYYVRLCDEHIYTMEDIMLDINNNLGYNRPQLNANLKEE